MGTARFVGGGGGGGYSNVYETKAETSEQNTGFVHALSAVMWQLKLFNPPPPTPHLKKRRKKGGTNTH